MKKPNKTTIYRIYHTLFSIIRKSKIICYLIFGIYYKNHKYGGYWDWVTIGLRSFLRQHKHELTNLLDIGTGPYGILSFYTKKLNKECSVVGIDYCKNLIENAKKIDATNEIKFMTSNLFEKVSYKYDYIIFNAPYVDFDFGKRNRILNDEFSVKRWSGGKHGIETIATFLSDVKPHLTKDGICALGVNGFYVKDKVIKDLIIEHDFLLFSVSKNPFSKANIYTLKHNNYAM